jgi:glycosyltransferase involved in cell wall biosynthesis
MGTLSRPETLEALNAMLLGQAGKRHVRVAGTPVPVAAFSELIESLANRASAEYAAVAPSAEQEIPEYLLDQEGELICDPAVPEERADALLELLGQQVMMESMDDEELEYEDFDDYDEEEELDFEDDDYDEEEDYDEYNDYE